MPRFLRSRLLVSYFIAFLLMLSAAAFSYYRGYILVALIFLLASLTSVLVVYANKKVRQKSGRVRSVFSLIPSSPRNFDYLVIGEYWNIGNQIPKGERAIYFSAPGRTMGAAFTILQHVFSVLKENGTVILIVKNKNIESNSFTVFDIPYLHPVTIRRLGLAALSRKSRYPLIFSPIYSIKFLFPAPKQSELTIRAVFEEKIQKFCEERNISIIILSD